MRAGLAVTVAAALIAGCSEAATTAAKPSAAATAPISRPQPFVSQPQPFNLFTHCGILTTFFAGRTFYLAEL